MEKFIHTIATITFAIIFAFITYSMGLGVTPGLFIGAFIYLLALKYDQQLADFVEAALVGATAVKTKIMEIIATGLKKR